MNHELLEKILACPTLPSLPAVAVRVIELTQNVDVSLDELAQTIQNDQGLSAKILRTVNSSFYGLRRRCGTINQALVMLGLSAVKSLALGFSLVSSLQREGDSSFDYVTYWRRGLYSAVASRCIAQEGHRSFADEVFFGALLQDVGIMALYQTLGKDYLRVMAQAGTDHSALVKFELAEYELQHPDIGAMLAQRWRLPEELVMPVKYHERPTAAPAESADLVRCVALGNLAHDVLTDPAPLPSLQRFHARAKQWFDLEPRTADALLRRIAESTKEVSTLFKLDTGAAADADAILSRAEEQLVQLADTPPTGGASLDALVSDSADVDPLTGVLTRSALLREAEAAFNASRTAGKALTALRVGIDGFGAVVQSHGTQAGDAALCETARLLLEKALPVAGTVGRWDDASFLVLFPGMDRTAASTAASDARSAIEGLGKVTKPKPAPAGPTFTASVGAVSVDPGSSQAFPRIVTFLAACAKAMDAAASAGGNCVRTFIPKAA